MGENMGRSLVSIGAIARRVAVIICCAISLLAWKLGPAFADEAMTIMGLSQVGATGTPILPDGTEIQAGQQVSGSPTIGVNHWLAVFLQDVGSTPVDPSKAILLLNNRQIGNLSDTIYLANLHALLFHLQRTVDNAADWGGILDSPTQRSRSIE